MGRDLICRSFLVPARYGEDAVFATELRWLADNDRIRRRAASILDRVFDAGRSSRRTAKVPAVGSWCDAREGTQCPTCPARDA
jgi:hypothetical protein